MILLKYTFTSCVILIIDEIKCYASLTRPAERKKEKIYTNDTANPPRDDAAKGKVAKEDGFSKWIWERGRRRGCGVGIGVGGGRGGGGSIEG